MTEHDAHILYLLGLSVFLAPTMKMGRGFAAIEDVPKDLLKKADEVYEREFKDEVERKIGLQRDFKERMDKLYGKEGQDVLVPRMPKDIRVSQVEVQQDLA